MHSNALGCGRQTFEFGFDSSSLTQRFVCALIFVNIFINDSDKDDIPSDLQTIQNSVQWFIQDIIISPSGGSPVGWVGVSKDKPQILGLGKKKLMHQFMQGCNHLKSSFYKNDLRTSGQQAINAPSEQRSPPASLVALGL